MKIERNIKIGDLLTSGALLLSVLTLALSWSKDRDLQIRQDADRIRSAAAKCVAKLDRWQAIQLAVFEELQPVYVETSEKVAAQPTQLGAARDFLWKEIAAAHSRASAKIAEEQIETAYADLLASYPPMRRDFALALEQLRRVDEESLGKLLESTQAAVLNVDLKSYSPPVLGNALRGASGDARVEFAKATRKVLDESQAKFFALIERDSSELVRE